MAVIFNSKKKTTIMKKLTNNQLSQVLGGEGGGDNWTT